MKKSLKVILTVVMAACICSISTYSAEAKAAKTQNLATYSVDVNGDKVKEKVYLHGVKTEWGYEKVYLYVENLKTKKVLTKQYISDYANLSGNGICFGDINGDKVSDIMPVLYIGGTNGDHLTKLYTMKGNKPKQIGIKLTGQWDSKLINDESGYSVLFTTNFSKKKYTLDINENEYLKDYIENNREYAINQDGRGPYWSLKDVNKDGVSEIVFGAECDGTCHGDYLATVNMYYKYNNKTSKWSPVDYDIKSNFPTTVQK